MAKRRVDLEDYFTSPQLASRCVGLIDDVLGLKTFDWIVEPSAGAGAFLNLLPPESRIGIDIAPRCDGVIATDFLKWRHRFEQGARVLTIGNPPFGQRSSMAVRFLQRACEFSEVVAFILPRSFKKYTFQNRIDPHFHLGESFECDEFVTPDGVSVAVRAVFQVWVRQAVPRSMTLPPGDHPHLHMRHAHISRTSPDELAVLRSSFDLAIPQVGSNFAPRDPSSVERGSHWFIRIRAGGRRDLFESLDFSFLDDMNTAHKSLSKRDIVTAYSAALELDGSDGATTGDALLRPAQGSLF